MIFLEKLQEKIHFEALDGNPPKPSKLIDTDVFSTKKKIIFGLQGILHWGKKRWFLFY